MLLCWCVRDLEPIDAIVLLKCGDMELIDLLCWSVGDLELIDAIVLVCA